MKNSLYLTVHRYKVKTKPHATINIELNAETATLKIYLEIFINIYIKRERILKEMIFRYFNRIQQQKTRRASSVSNSYFFYKNEVLRVKDGGWRMVGKEEAWHYIQFLQLTKLSNTVISP
jgi:hypothetical protein